MTGRESATQQDSYVRALRRLSLRKLQVTTKGLLPPRELSFSDGVLSWKPPEKIEGVTHYRVYQDNELECSHQVPVGQNRIQDNLIASQVFVSSYNEPLDVESRPVPLVSLVAPIGSSAIGNVTINSVVATYEAINDNDNVMVKLSVQHTPPSPLGEFDRVQVFVEIPDGSNTVRGGETFTYLGSGGAATVYVYHEPPTSTQYWRVYVVSGSPQYMNQLQLTGDASPSPNYQVEVSPVPSSGSGTEWAPNVTSFTANVAYAINQVGGLVYRIYGTFAPSTDPKYHGVRIVGQYASEDFTLSFEPRGISVYTSKWYPVPASPQNWTIYAQSQGPNYRFNSIVHPTTPHADVTVQDQAGLGGLKLNRVDVTTFDTTELEVSGDVFQIKQLSADKIVTGTLKVGGGSSKPGQMGVYDGVGALIGWIGQSGTYYGGWLKQLWVGGTDPTTALFYINSSGNLKIESSGSYHPSLYIENNGIEVTVDNKTDVIGYFGLKVEHSTTKAEASVRAGHFRTEYDGNHVISIQSFSSQSSIGLYYLTTERVAISADSTGGHIGLTGSAPNMYSGGVEVIAGAISNFSSMKVGGVEVVDASRNITGATFKISTSTIVDASRNATFNSLDIDSVAGIDASGNLDCESVAVNGTTKIGSSGQIILREFSQAARPTLTDGEMAQWWDSDEGGGTMFVLIYDGVNYFKVAMTAA